MELYKKLDDENGYTIFLSNYGISVSNLEKIAKVSNKDKTNEKPKDDYKSVNKEENSVKNVFEKVETNVDKSCFAVNKNNLNVD